MSNPRIIVSLDFSDADKALEHVKRLSPEYCRLKVGKELFTAGGPTLVEKLISQDFDVFLDLKFHDIPNTVAKACATAAQLGIWMLNVHATGGREMLIRAREAINKADHQPFLIGVTVLTSMSTEDLHDIGVSATVDEQVFRLARLCKDADLDGVVCSAMETERLHTEFGNEFILVTPGIRPAGVNPDDQKRVVTPADAVMAGSHYLVIGRPIIQAVDPLQALKDIEDEIKRGGGRG